MRDIGKNIKSLREEKSMTQDELAEQLFVTRQTVSNYETGRSRPDVEMLTKIAEVLGVDANAVIYGKQEPAHLRQEKIRLAVGAGVTLVLGILWFSLASVFQKYQETTYDIMPYMVLTLTAFPMFLMGLGWSILQGCHVFLGAKKLPEEKVKWLRRGIWIVLAVWVLSLLPPLVDIIRQKVILWQYMKTHTSSLGLDTKLADWLYNIVWNPISYWVLFGTLNYWPLFPVLGAGAWLGGFPKQKTEENRPE